MRRRRGRGRPPWRSAADAAIFLAALLLAGLAARQAGWLQPETGRYEAIDGDSLRKAGQEYRLHGIDAPELHQECSDGDGHPYPCGRLARDELRRHQELGFSLPRADSIARRLIEDWLSA